MWEPRRDGVLSERQAVGSAGVSLSRSWAARYGYAGATGSHEFSWRLLLEAEDRTIQGRAIDLKGRAARAGTAGVPK